MSVLQNVRLNDFMNQIKVKNLEFPSVLTMNKWCWEQNSVEDLLDKLNLNSVNVETFISSYYWWRKEQSEITKVKITPHRLSLVYKLAENINFLRCLYLKSKDSVDDSLDIIDGVISIFFNELTIISDKSEQYSEKQLFRSYWIERVLSRMETRAFSEVNQFSKEEENKAQVFQNMNRKKIVPEISSDSEIKPKLKSTEVCQSWEALYSNVNRESKIPLILVDFETTYLGLIKSIFTR